MLQVREMGQKHEQGFVGAYRVVGDNRKREDPDAQSEGWIAEHPPDKQFEAIVGCANGRMV